MAETNKICEKCSVAYPEQAVVCAYCNVPLRCAPSQSRSTVQRQPRFRMAVLFVLLCFAGLVVFALFADKTPTKVADKLNPSVPPPVGSNEQSVPKPEAQPSIPDGYAIASVTPYQLLKNPFLHQGKLVRLDPFRFPIIVNGSVYGYGNCHAQFSICNETGSIGLQFGRMIEAHKALYSVLGEDEQTSVNTTKLGELIVDMGDSEEEPPLDKDWVVIPVLPEQATNGYGARIQVSMVRFVRLALVGDSPRVLNPH